MVDDAEEKTGNGETTNGNAQSDAPPAKTSRINFKKLVQSTIPITTWLPKYTVSEGLHDLLAGFTVGLTEVPQGIAYASVAGLPPEYGLYSGFMGCFMYALFGTCKDLNIGPTAIMALMAQSYIDKMGNEVAVLLTFLSGCIIFILGLLHLGFVIEFFSYPVISGFTCAASVQIATSQLKSLLGLKGKANEFLESLETVIEHISETKKWDLTLGLASIVVLILMREMKRFSTVTPEMSTRRKVWAKTIWLLSLARNALVVLVGTTLAYFLKQSGRTPFTLIDHVGQGLPPFELPHFSASNNETGEFFTFGEILGNYGSGLAFVPLVAILESVAIAKAFSKGKKLDATQELIALGICNIMGSFVSSMPTTGSFTRTAVNNASGVKTPMAGVITGIIVVIALALLTSTFSYIPKTTLAAVVISAMIYLFDYEAIIYFWKTRKLDLIPFTVTFVASLLLGLEYGIVIGIAVHLIYVLYPTARPDIEVARRKLPQGDVYVVAFMANMQFPVAEHFRDKITADCSDVSCTVVIDFSSTKYLDSTVIKNLQNLITAMKARGQPIVLWNLNDDVLRVITSTNDDLNTYCKKGNLEDIIEDPNVVSSNGTYSIQ